MKIVSIFAEENKEGLFSIHFPDEPEDELTKCMTKWFDIEYLHHFFTEHETDLNNGYYKKIISISEAISKTQQEAYELFQRLSDFSKSTENSGSETLSNAFQPLNDGKFSQSELQEEKAKSDVNLKCLRIYAIKISPNTYVVTGGAIKLVNGMDERTHLLKEKHKIYQVRQFLYDLGILDQEDFSAHEI